MKKTLMTLAAVFCTMIAVMLTSCEKETINKRGYTYDVETGWWVERNQAEHNAIVSAIEQILGNEGTMLHVYYDLQDERIKSSCEALKDQYSNLQSTLLTYFIIRNTDDASGRTKDTIATYFFGRAAGAPYAKYKLDRHTHEMIEQLNAIRDSIGEEMYQAQRRTFNRIGHEFTSKLQEYTDHYNPEAESTQRVLFLCDSIANAHLNDSIFVPIHLTVSKIDLFNQSTDIWDRTLPANM
jgi:DNA-binding winged helix-turn-helix (wHTH) protein